jgi:hypothetical protein
MRKSKKDKKKPKVTEDQLMKEVEVSNPEFVKWIRSKSGKKE